MQVYIPKFVLIFCLPAKIYAITVLWTGDTETKTKRRVCNHTSRIRYLLSNLINNIVLLDVQY